MSLATTTPLEMAPLTRTLAAQASTLRYGDIDADSLTVARQCILDWFAVTLAGAAEPLARTLAENVAEDGGRPQATILGHGRGTMAQAALVNGSSAHALDYDDVNSALHGHPTVPVVPAVLALAEHQGRSGRDLLTAFVAGYETECRIGSLVDPGHYDAGFHATATIGTFGAAAGAARLLGLDEAQTAMALGIAGTQAAGLKSVFGTMCKPLHAGKAAANGLFAARLAQKGFTSRDDILECEQGFAETQSTVANFDAALARPKSGFHVRNNVFKYHAACYGTHSSVEALRQLREAHAFSADDVEAVTLQVTPNLLTICDIKAPETGLECKFSLCQMAAFVLAGLDTAALETYSDENASRPDLVALRQRVQVQTGYPGHRNGARVELDLKDGRSYSKDLNVGLPAEDLVSQNQLLLAKFHGLADPILGRERAEALAAEIAGLDGARDLSAMMAQASIAA